jgi:hypothetical protein
MLKADQALFQSAPLFAPVEFGRTYQLAAKSVSGENSSTIKRFLILILILGNCPWMFLLDVQC